MPADTPERSDQELLAAYAGGDPLAFDALYRRHRDWVVALAFRFTGDGHESLDVLQETFAYLLSRLPSLVLTAPLRSFLYPVVKHVSLATRRKLRRRVFSDDALDSVSGPSRGTDAGASEPAGPATDLSGLFAALGILPDMHKEVLLMRVVDEMTMQEIAAALSIAVGTVKSRLHHALVALRGDPRTRRYFLNDEQ